MRLDEAVGDYLLRGTVLGHRTSEWYEQKLRFFRKWCEREHLDELESLRSRHLYSFQQWLQGLTVAELDARRPYGQYAPSPYTVRGYVQVIRSFSAWSAKEGYLSSDPFKGVERPKEPQGHVEPFDADQIQALLKVTNAASAQAMRDRAMVLVLLDTGIRVSEFVGLTLDRVYLQDDHPWLEIAWQTSKGQKAREVSLGRYSSQALRRYIRVVRRPHDPKSQAVWVNRYGQPLTRGGVLQAIKELAKAAHITGVRASPHTFRHTYSAQFLRNGGDVYTLSRSLGHSSVGVTERYIASFKPRDVRQRQQALPSVAESLLS